MATAHEVRTLVERVWVGEEGGPLLLLPESLLPEWSGTDVPPYRAVNAHFRWNVKEPRACDYDRACDVQGYAGVITVGYGEGLVITEGFQATTWIPAPWGGLFARWECAESDDAMESVLAQIPDTLVWQHVGEFRVTSSPLELFNSAEPGLEQVMSRLTVDLDPAEYIVRWTRYAPDRETAIGLIELRRAAT